MQPSFDLQLQQNFDVSSQSIFQTSEALRQKESDSDPS